jgi:integrase
MEAFPSSPISILGAAEGRNLPWNSRHTAAGLNSERTNREDHACGMKNSELAASEPYCLRHTALTRLAEAGCDAFTLTGTPGHSSTTITQRYNHPQTDAIERAFTQLTNGTKLITEG